MTEKHIYFYPKLPSTEAKLSTDQAVQERTEGYISAFPASQKINLENVYKLSFRCVLFIWLLKIIQIILNYYIAASK